MRVWIWNVPHRLLFWTFSSTFRAFLLACRSSKGVGLARRSRSPGWALGGYTWTWVQPVSWSFINSDSSATLPLPTQRYTQIVLKVGAKGAFPPWSSLCWVLSEHKSMAGVRLFPLSSFPENIRTQASWKPEHRPSPNSRLASTLVLHFSASGNVGNNCLLSLRSDTAIPSWQEQCLWMLLEQKHRVSMKCNHTTLLSVFLLEKSVDNKVRKYVSIFFSRRKKSTQV